jgi:hypothetical protein
VGFLGLRAVLRLSQQTSDWQRAVLLRSAILGADFRVNLFDSVTVV